MPGHVSSPQRPLPLNVLVVGGGIAGVATAYAMQKAGHRVTVLEKTDGKQRSHGGLRSPPNMTRILNQWGLAKPLQELGHRIDHFLFQQGETGELIGQANVPKEFTRQLMGDFLFIQHGDLHSLLFDLASQEGVQFNFNSTVVNVDTQTISVTLQCGEIRYADIVVVADGAGSSVREYVLGRNMPETPNRDVSLTFTIPTDIMRQDDELRPLTETSDWSIWLGAQYLFHGSTINGGEDFFVTYCFPLRDEDTCNFSDDWNTRIPLDHFKLDMDTFEPRVQKIFKLADIVTVNVHMNRPHLDSLVCERARVVLVGDAAHPMMPSGQANTALGIEDAQTLGSLFSRLQHPDQVPRLLSAYEEIRQKRCETTEDWERRKRALLTLPYGPAQEARDASLRKSTTLREWHHMDPDVFVEIWDDEIHVFEHDATESVEDWWTKWGALLERGSPTQTQGLAVTRTRSLEVSVSKVT
ncbi:hypothetical protein BD779DRAFT_1675877 [Infundibulicybe gibba]|nr:hypothetical protein BD779DRAFT_1675877 [Infundibulicybe gibba]